MNIDVRVTRFYWNYTQIESSTLTSLFLIYLQVLSDFVFLHYEQLFCSNHWQSCRFISFKFIRAAMTGLWVDCSLILIAVSDPQTRSYLMIQYACMWEACTPCLFPLSLNSFYHAFLLNTCCTGAAHHWGCLWCNYEAVLWHVWTDFVVAVI